MVSSVILASNWDIEIKSYSFTGKYVTLKPLVSRYLQVLITDECSIIDVII